MIFCIFENKLYNKMKFKHSDIEIPREDPFKNCKLNRQPNAIILTQIVQNYSDSFVLSIN